MNRVHVSWPRLHRVALWTAAVLVTLALVLALLGVRAVRRSFPQQDGTLRLPGLSAPVTVYRDGHGIPQVYARTAGDLFRAQGYLHAQDRFWEMDFRRHVTGGRLAELFGESQVETDTYLRTMGWRRVAEQEWQTLAADTKRYLEAYADGVNAWLAGHDGGAASLEYTLLGLQNPGYRIEKWSPVDSLAWLKAMAWDLRGNMETEIERAALLAAGLTRRQVEELYPAYPYERNSPIVTRGRILAGAFDQNAAGQPPTTPPPTGGGAGGGGAVGGRTITALADGLARLPVMLGDGGAGIGSNSWVIGGALTDTGKPILANDPHLSPSMPGIWYQMGLHCECSFDVTGFTFSGLPGVVIGHNARVAWGFTNLNPDVTDLYLERVDGDRVQVDGQWRALETRAETIKVAGGKDVTITVRTSRHGPLLSDASATLRDIGVKPPVDAVGSPAPVAAAPAGSKVSPGQTVGAVGGDGDLRDGYAVALSWTALQPGRTADALFALDAAANWTDFRAAAAKFEVPAQNLIYADVDGNIGYQSPGKIPVRGKGDGRWMAPGWDSAYDWSGFIPFAELPSVYNPTDGYLVTANQAVTGPQYERFLTSDWSYGYRSQRIHDMIDSARGDRKITVADVARMQFDNRNGMAAFLAPRLRDVRLSGFAATAQALLAGWDYQQPADGATGTAAARSSAAAAYYNAVWRHLLALTFDELPADYQPGGGDRWFEVMRSLLAHPDSSWWDDKRTPAVERAPQILTAALTTAADELRRDQGDLPADWRWGRMHTLTVRNQTFGTSGIGPVEWLFNNDRAGVSGGDAIVNATAWTASEGYEVHAVPSMRMIVDLSNLDASRWIQLTGNSGHAFHPNYHDQFELWRTGRTLPMRWNTARIVGEAEQTLTLQP